MTAERVGNRSGSGKHRVHQLHEISKDARKAAEDAQRKRLKELKDERTARRLAAGTARESLMMRQDGEGSKPK